MNSPWTDERVEQLTRLRKEGLSASAIAKAMGHGVTRNAIIGKMQRLFGYTRPKVASDGGSTDRRTRSQASYAKQKASAGGSKRRSAPKPRKAVLAGPPRMLPLERLGAHDCRWPVGDPGTDRFGFCGHPAMKDKSYCEAHAAIAFRKPGEMLDEDEAAW